MPTRNQNLSPSLRPIADRGVAALPPAAWNELAREVEVIEKRFTHPTLLRKAWTSVVARIDRLIRFGTYGVAGRITSPPAQ